MQSELLDLKMVPYSRRQDQQNRNNHDDDDKSQSGGNDYETPDVKPTIIDRGRFMVEPIIVAKPASAAVGSGGGGGKVLIRYRECMRNHAASIGGHANDGCGEFMQGIEGLRCAACGCHRNFHRKEIQCGGGGRDGHIRHLQPPPPPPPLGGARWEKEKKKTGGGFPSLSSIALPQFSNGNNARGVDLGLNNQSSDDGRSETPEEIRSGGGGGGGGNKLLSSNSSNKRFRTKFSQEQKEKMLEFAEKLGWRIQKQDDFAISQFCLEVGVKRQVLKVWMHNNKITYKKRESIGNAPPPLQGHPPPLQGHPPPPLPEMDTESPPSSDSAPPPLPPPPSHLPINNHIE